MACGPPAGSPGRQLHAHQPPVASAADALARRAARGPAAAAGRQHRAAGPRRAARRQSGRAAAGACRTRALSVDRGHAADGQRRGADGPPTVVKAPGRIVAIGDIHGDMRKTITALGISGVYRQDEAGAPVWCGGDTTLVQLGDVLDRGDEEIGVIMLLRELDRQARREGGAVYMLNGNHESLNVSGNYRYVTEGAMRESAAAAGLSGPEARDRRCQTEARNRMYAPGRPMARELARNPTVLIVNSTLFAHGGVLPCHVTYGLERLNAEVAAWMRGDRLPDGRLAEPPYLAMGGAESVMWNRSFGRELSHAYERYCVCSQLRATLAMLGVKHLVVGHTPQMQGANCECNGQVWRVDVGMSGGVLNAVPQVLEIAQEASGMTHVRLLTAKPPYVPYAGGAGCGPELANSLAPFRMRELGQLAQ